MSCQGPHVPQDYLYRTSPNEKVGTLVTNEALSEELSLKNHDTFHVGVGLIFK